MALLGCDRFIFSNIKFVIKFVFNNFYVRAVA